MRMNDLPRNRRRLRARPGAAVVELAFVLPLVMFLFVLTVDYARVFYYTLTVQNCARNGALWASDPVAKAASAYASVEEAALADAGTLPVTPTVTSTSGTDDDGNGYVEATV